MFYSLNAENDTIPNTSPALHIKQKERMVYIALSEYFFDSAMYAYYRSGVLSLEIANEQVSVLMHYNFNRENLFHK